MGQALAGERICLACRVTVLSRYNSDPLCAACARASRDSAGIVPTWLWDSRPMREALARVDIPAVVAIFRAASGLSQLELGNLIEGWSQSLVSLTERGLRDTLYDIRRLRAFADTVGMPRAALAPLILGHPDAILECDSTVALQGVDTVDLGRREFSFLAAGLAAADLGIESAWFAHDADEQTLARQLYGEAALLADSAGDGTQRVQLYTNMAQQYSYLARHTGGRGLARQALQFAGRAEDAARHEPSPALHAFVSQRQAVAHAQLGDEVAFRSAITTARRELDRGPHETDPPWTRTSATRRSPCSRRSAKRISARPPRPSGSGTPCSTIPPSFPATRPVTGRCWPGHWCTAETSTRQSTTA